MAFRRLRTASLGPRSAYADRLEPRRLLSATPALVGDINATTGQLDPRGAVTVGGTMYFTGRNSGEDWHELWKTDGTAGGTVQVKDINPGVEGSFPEELTAVGSTLYFSAADAAHGRELWKSDGTPGGTVLVRDVVPGIGQGTPTNLTDVDGVLYFAVNGGSLAASARQVWRTDGTEAGTVAVTSGSATSEPEDFLALGGKLLFVSKGNLRVLNPATGGVTVLPVISGTPNSLVRFNGAAYFASAGDLYRTDGTPAGTVRVKDVDYGVGVSVSLNFMTVSGDRLFFYAAHGRPVTGELWVSDGTTDGTRGTGLTDLSLVYTQFVPVGTNSVAFRYGTAANGIEPWVCDGDTGVAGLLVDTIPGPTDGTFGFNGARYGDAVYFGTSGDADRPARLWKTDGTPAGTSVVTPMPEAYGVGPLAVVNGLLMIDAYGAQPYKGDLFRSDGTAAGTSRLTVTSAGDASSMTDEGSLSNSPAFLRGGDWVYFPADDGLRGRELWRAKSDGTSPELFADVVPGAYGSDPRDLALADDGTIYFSALRPDVGRELFRVVPGGAPQLVSDLNPGPLWSDFYGLATLGNALYFWQRQAGIGEYRLRQFNPGTGAVTNVTADGGQELAPSSAPIAPQRAGDRLYVRDQALYQIRGGAAGDVVTRLSSEDQLIDAVITATGDGSLYFHGYAGPPGGAGWGFFRAAPDRTITRLPAAGHVIETVLDGTGAIFANGIYYAARESEFGIYRTDLLTGVATLLGPATADAGAIAVAGGSLYFRSSDEKGSGVFRATGASPSTGVRVTEPSASGDAAFEPLTLSAAGGDLYVIGYGGAKRSRYELWRVTPTLGGATKVSDLQPTDTVEPRIFERYWNDGRFALTATATHLFFPAYHTVTGVEPWALPLAGPPSVASGRFDVTADRQQVVLTFDRPVDPSTLAQTDLVVKNLTTGATIPADQITLTLSAAGDQLTVRFGGYANGVLPDGDYRVTLPAGSVSGSGGGGPLAGDSVTSFFILSGDIDGDRTVGASDFSVLAANFGKTGQTWATGDLNYDGAVGPGDFNLLASRFGTTLTAPPPPASAASAAAELRSGPRGAAAATMATTVSSAVLHRSAAKTVRRPFPKRP